MELHGHESKELSFSKVWIRRFVWEHDLCFVGISTPKSPNSLMESTVVVPAELVASFALSTYKLVIFEPLWGKTPSKYLNSCLWKSHQE